MEADAGDRAVLTAGNEGVGAEMLNRKDAPVAEETRVGPADKLARVSLGLSSSLRRYLCIRFSEIGKPLVFN